MDTSIDIFKDALVNTNLSRVKSGLVTNPYAPDAFEEEPVSLDVFVRDRKYLGLPPLSDIQEEAVEYATQIYKPETLSLLGWKKRRQVREVVLMWGKGGGKDYVSRIILLRIAYLLLVLKRPQAYFYHPDADTVERIDMLNTATNETQAVNVFFSTLRKYATKTPFFKNRCEVLTQEIRFDKSIYLHSGHSEAEPMEGMNLICVVLDEIAAFKTDEEVSDLKQLRIRKNIPRSASAMYDFATTSVATRFPQAGKVVLISFPRFRGDFITTKYEEGKDDPRVYVKKAATFEANTTKKKSDFDDMRIKMPELYSARILCEPGIAEDAFFKNVSMIYSTFKRDYPSPFAENGELKNDFICRDNFSRFGHADLSKNRDSAAVAFVHAYDVVQTKVVNPDTHELVIIEKPLLRVDCVRYFKAAFGGEINFQFIEDFILDFVEVRGFKTELFSFDGYQSVQMQQSLRDRGIEVEELSVDKNRKAYEALQDTIYSGRLSSYYDKILVEDELPFLIDVRGRKINHRRGRSKDGADALAGSVYNCVNSASWGEMSFWVA